MENHSVKILNCNIDYSAVPTIKAAKVVYINGRGSLKTFSQTIPDATYGNRYLSQFCLNQIPLVQINAPGCPTCADVIATGHGIDQANCQEIKTTQEALNAPFVSLEQSIDTLSPLLTLLKSGLYLVADAICFPTDGNGNFFWNTPNGPIENPATAEVILPDLIPAQPIYLFPTQDTDCYNQERVSYYMDLFQRGDRRPRAVAYNFSPYLNFMIDGHHKACAAALLGQPLECILIIPCNGYSTKGNNIHREFEKLCFSEASIQAGQIPAEFIPTFGGSTAPAADAHMRIHAGTINHRTWEKEYLQSCCFYPSLREYTASISEWETYIGGVTDDTIRRYLETDDDEDHYDLQSVLMTLAYRRDHRLKQTAFECAKRFPKNQVELLAYRILASMKGDSEVEQFFIDYLVSCEDPYASVLPIIHSYWNRP